MAASTLPLSTYRLQMSAAFTFADAAAITDYLASLGISHCTLSTDEDWLRSLAGFLGKQRRRR